MEGFGVSGHDCVTGMMKKRRSNTSRRPRPDPKPFLDCYSPSSSTPPSDNVSKVSSDEILGYDTSIRRKEINLNSAALRGLSYNCAEGEILSKKGRNGGPLGEFDGFYTSSSSRGVSVTKNEKGRYASDSKRCSEGVLAPANWKSMSKVKDNFESQSDGCYGDVRSGDAHGLGQLGVNSNGLGSRGESSSSENKLRKVKLKVGGVTRTIHAKSTLDGAADGSTKPSCFLDASRQRQKPIPQDNSDDDRSLPDQTNCLSGVSWKNFSGAGITLALKAETKGKMSGSFPSKQTDKPHSMPSSEPVRKSKRVPKRRILDGALDDGDQDDELRYLGRLKSAKSNVYYGTEYDEGPEDSRKRKTSKASRSRVAGGEYDDVERYSLLRSKKEGKNKSRLERESEDAEYIEEEDDDEQGSDGGFEANKRKKQRKESLDSLADTKKEISLTTRQRALQSGKDSGVSTSVVEFPNGLPAAPPRKQKEKLSEVELQLKKAEAAQRRRMQVEKAARESEAEAIRKILGQDSSRKKREDKLRKQRDALAQEKAANATIIPANMVRWVIGPSGTVVTFPDDVGLPSILESKPCSYPPPREKCAGPSCTNVYRYRDSKSNLPLCSLQCYRAVNAMIQPLTTC